MQIRVKIETKDMLVCVHEGQSGAQDEPGLETGKAFVKAQEALSVPPKAL